MLAAKFYRGCQSKRMMMQAYPYTQLHNMKCKKGTTKKNKTFKEPHKNTPTTHQKRNNEKNKTLSKKNYVGATKSLQIVDRPRPKPHQTLKFSLTNLQMVQWN